IDGNLEAMVLQQACGRQPNRAAPQHSGAPERRLQSQVDCQLSGSPGQSNSASSVPVVVNDYLSADVVCSNQEAAGPVRAQPSDHSYDAVGEHLDLGQADSVLRCCPF